MRCMSLLLARNPALEGSVELIASTWLAGRDVFMVSKTSSLFDASLLALTVSGSATMEEGLIGAHSPKLLRSRASQLLPGSKAGPSSKKAACASEEGARS